MIAILRKLPLLAVLLGFIAAFVWLDNDKQVHKTDFYSAYSLHNTSPRGASLAFRYLKESRVATAPAVKELNRAIAFAELEPDAVVFRIAPRAKRRTRFGDDEAEVEPDPEKPKKKTKEPKPPAEKPLFATGEEDWIKRGGRLVLAIDEKYGPLETVVQVRADPFEKSFPLWPGVEELKPTASRALKGPPLASAHAIFTIHGEVFIARMPLGKGELIALAAPEIFSNDHLETVDNLKLLTQLAPATRPIYFDEFIHGLQDSPGVNELLVRWGLGMAMLILCVGGAFAFWRARKPIGPPEDDYKETRTQAIDFVGSLAPLYNRALSPEQALALHYKNFIHAVSVQSGLRGPELAARIRKLLDSADEAALSGQIPLAPHVMSHLLRTLNEAYGRLERAHRR